MWIMKKNNKGFTLIEILAVLVLMSLIVIIAIPSVKSITNKSRIKLLNTKVQIAEEALTIWAENNKYCFEEPNGCGVFSNCVNSSEKIQCETIFKKLADNNIIEYDSKEGGNKYVIDPTNNMSMNNYVIEVEYDKKNSLVSASLTNDESKKAAEKIIVATSS